MPDTIGDAVHQIADDLKYRAKNKLLTAYVLSWILVNHTFFFAAIGDLSEYQKIWRSYTHSIEGFQWAYFFLYPTCSAFIYVFWAGHAMKSFAYKWTKKKENELALKILQDRAEQIAAERKLRDEEALKRDIEALESSIHLKQNELSAETAKLNEITRSITGLEQQSEELTMQNSVLAEDKLKLNDEVNQKGRELQKLKDDVSKALIEHTDIYQKIKDLRLRANELPSFSNPSDFISRFIENEAVKYKESVEAKEGMTDQGVHVMRATVSGFQDHLMKKLPLIFKS